MITASQLLGVLSRHIGKGNGIGVKPLAAQLGCEERNVRRLVEALRDEGHAICAHPSTGYYIAETPEELQHTCDFLRSRAIHSLTLEARLKKIPLPDLLGQLHIAT